MSKYKTADLPSATYTHPNRYDFIVIAAIVWLQQNLSISVFNFFMLLLVF